MAFTARQYAEIFDRLLKEVGGEKIDEAIGSFVRLLEKNNDLHLGEKIIEEYQNVGIKQVRVTSAKKISDSARKELRKLGKVEENIDEFLLGGARVRIGDTLIDGSTRNALENLRGRIMR